MLRLAIGDNAAWRVCTIEIDRGGFSYTVDTLRQIREELPDAALFFLIGADALNDVAKWKEPREIFRMATPLVVHRAGQASPNFGELQQVCAAETEPQVIQMPAMEVSSSEIRRRVGVGESIEELVPEGVAGFISEHGLYRESAV